VQGGFICVKHLQAFFFLEDMAPGAISVIPRPPEAEFRHIQHLRHDDIAIALAMSAEDFKDFKVCHHFLRVIIS